MATDAASLVSFGDGFVTVCSYGRADCGRDLQLGRPHRLLPSGAGAWTPPARQAVLLRGVLSDRGDRHHLLRHSTPSGGRRVGRADPRELPFQHQGLSQPHRPRARGPDPAEAHRRRGARLHGGAGATQIERQAGRRPLPVPAMVDQPARGARVAARRSRPPPRRPARHRIPPPLVVRPRCVAGNRGPAPRARMRLRRRRRSPDRLGDRSARCSRSRHRGCASRASTGATARPGTRVGPPAAIASTTCTPPPSSRSGSPRCAPRAMPACRSMCC